ncbi:MAG: phenylalanine--tRNA ligase subunit beta [Bacteroidetes bacterium]|nr:phenylalanine--tRNA ligase subunit beta [Bacteroidota bacterium]
MKISLNWLKQYIDLEGISSKDIVHKLTMSGLEVEEVIDQNKLFEKFVVGFVTDKEKHPNADRLSVCKVSDGSETFQVICGAPNVERGQKVVFAPIGTLIPNGNFKIKKTKIRGVESHGMICAEDELGVSEDHSGIMVLDADSEEGTPITKVLGLNDVIMEIAVTPNRPDALSHIGVARDLAALFNKKLKIHELSLDESNDDINSLASIKIEDELNCPRYSSRVVTDIKIEESPDWLKHRLKSIGLRPINNIVDITNFVMHECGQPLHAFDLDRLNGKIIIIKSTKTKTRFTTLDSKERELAPGTLMICDAEKDVAIAGVMGGENSEIYDDTKNVLIESAYFNPSSIRKTSKHLQLSTDASYRFERGTDPGNTMYAAERTAQLLMEIAGGKIAKGSIDIYPKIIKELELKLRLSRVSKILGFDVSKENTITILTDLGFTIDEISDDELNVTVPTFRPDVEREVDLIEEIARIFGYDNIPTIPKISIPLGAKQDETSFTDHLKEYANSLGLFEMINNPLQLESLAKLTGRAILVSNPQSMDMAYLRTSLLSGALSVVSRNLNKGEKNLELFEIGNVFNLYKGKNTVNSFDDYVEDEQFIFVLTGKKTEREWYSEEKDYDFFDLKGIVNTFMEKISLDNVLNDSYYTIDNSIYDYCFTGNIKDQLIGLGGKVKSSVLKQFDIDQDVFCFEMNLGKLKEITVPEKSYNELLKYPKVVRDFAFIFDKAIKFEEVQNLIQKKGSKLLKDVKVFDIFESIDLGKDKKSMAFQLEYFDEERTLTEEEVEKDFSNLIKLVSKGFNAKLRG